MSFYNLIEAEKRSTCLENDLQDFLKLLTKPFSGCLPIWKIRSLFPSHSLCSFYETVKLHKNSEPKEHSYLLWQYGQ
jgi:hypothetical protein